MLPSMLEPSSTDRAIRARNSAEAAVRDYCGWHVAPVIVSELVLDAPGVRTLFLPSLKVIEIIEFSVNGVPVDVDALEWSENGFVRAARLWPDRLRAIRVKFEHGFEDVPAIGGVISAVAERDLASPSGAVRERANQVSIDHSQVAPGVSGGIALMAHETALLDKYNLHLRRA